MHRELYRAQLGSREGRGNCLHGWSLIAYCKDHKNVWCRCSNTTTKKSSNRKKESTDIAVYCYWFNTFYMIIGVKDWIKFIIIIIIIQLKNRGKEVKRRRQDLWSRLVEIFDIFGFDICISQIGQEGSERREFKCVTTWRVFLDMCTVF